MTVFMLPLAGLAFIFFLITTLIIRHNKKHFIGLASLNEVNPVDIGKGFRCSVDECERENGYSVHAKSKKTEKIGYSKISVLIPARNEEKNIIRLLESIGKQTYQSLEIHLLDDHSEDNTKFLAEEFASASHLDLTVHTGLDKPDGWLGKNWACHQLAQHATGDIFVFLDADTWMAPTAIGEIVSGLHQYQLDFATVWPHQTMVTKSEKTIISTVYSTIITYLPTLYSYQSPRWIPGETLKKKVKPMFAAACGQCMIFTRDAYRSSGGHEMVKDKIVEDVILAKQVVRSGKVMRMFHGTDRLWCRMYESHSEIFNGFRKNFFAGFGNKLIPFLMAWLLHLAFYVLPPLFFLLAVTDLFATAYQYEMMTLSAVLTVFPLLQRMWIRKFLKWPKSCAWLHLPGILWFHMLAIVVLHDRILKTGGTWKGRPV